MKLHHRSLHTKIFSTLFALISFTTLATAGSAPSHSPYGDTHNPVRIYYFGYNMMSPGFSLGTEVNLLWTKMERGGCKGARISDRQLTFIPTIGMFQNEATTLSVFGDLELNYTVTYRGGITLEIFGAPGYAQMLSKGDQTSAKDTSSRTLLSTDAHSGFMPMAGAGIGYDFQKLNGKDCPLEINFRGMATSTDIADLSIFPSFQAGLIYNF